MTATLNDEVAELRRANAELKRRLDEARAERDEGEAQKAAISEVLGVINSSPGDLAPVFDAMLEKALRLCSAAHGSLFTFVDGTLHQVASADATPQLVALRQQQGPNRIEPGTVFYPFLEGQDIVHLTDVRESAAYRDFPAIRERLDAANARSLLAVALRKDEALLGVLDVYRQEVQPFNEKQIALLENFAAQAVIAIENARLITETREALEQQTATAEVLGVINSSPGDLAPVFDAMLEKAQRLCEAAYGVLLTYDGERFHTAAIHGVPSALEAVLRKPFTLPQGSNTSRLLAGEAVVQTEDLAAVNLYRSGSEVHRAFVDFGEARTALAVPLKKDNSFLGALWFYRREVRLFTEKQISLVQSFASQAVIAMENARLITETREALEQQTATAEVLQVINSSPGDLGPVFDAMLEKALRLCAASCGTLQSYDGNHFHVLAVRGPSEFEEWGRHLGPLHPEPGTTLALLAQGERVIQVADMAESEGYQIGAAYRREMVDIGGFRTILSIALHKDDALVGALHLYRQEVRSFTDKQIALLQNFAAQAVIAMESARLINETREALEQQTATAKVLGVINSSPGNLIPVFEAMLEKAVGLCDAAFGILGTFDGEALHAVAFHGLPAEVAGMRYLREPIQPQPGMATYRLASGEDLVQFDDIAAVPAYGIGEPAREFIERSGARSYVVVALRKDGVLLGQITIYRQEIRPFTNKQIALLQNFAAQAVIAIENARLITETREALEQQTATAEVLGVINSSPGDLAPVFDAILDKAHSLCAVSQGCLVFYDGEYFRVAAVRGYPPHMAEAIQKPFRGNVFFQRMVEGERFVQIDDVRAAAGQLDDSVGQAALDHSEIRTWLGVPLRKDGAFLGHISAARSEVRPFTAKEITLLESFAAQAVIAMENARLLGELRNRTNDLQESLEYQTATSDVLKVISRSTFDLRPVLDTLVETAARLCNADMSLMFQRDGDGYRGVSFFGLPPAWRDFIDASRRQDPNYAVARPGRATIAARVLLEGGIVHVHDVSTDPEYERTDAVRLGGLRTVVGVPLLGEGEPIGVFTLCRQRVEPFTERQIELVRTFADQAVIAIENARLITETREALEQQTATAEVLQVINSSPGNLTPVFDAMLTKAMELCGASFGVLRLYDGEVFDAVAVHGDPRIAERIRQLGPIRPETGSLFEPLVQGEEVLHIADLLGSDANRADSNDRERIEAGGIRTWLAVALRRQDALLGAIIVYRKEVRLFTDKQIALLQNFAAQAVIAMENARLITETREALEQQTATAEIMQVINSSPSDLAPVFDAMLEKAMRLCEASFGHLRTYDGDQFHLAAIRGEPSLVEQVDEAFRPGPHNPIQLLLRGERIVHVADTRESEAYRNDQPFRTLVDLSACRAMMMVALRKDERLLGFINVYRKVARTFSHEQIALLENFAAQAVIAMENARLLDEIRQRQAELRVTFDNMADGVAMFDEDLRLAAWNRNFQQIADLPEVFLAERPTYADYLRILTERGELDILRIDEELSRRLEDTDQELRLERTRPNGQVIEVRRNAVPDGGFVLIYSDITERKRSEAEIRAARDAAEATLRDLRAAQANLIQAEKMASLGQLTAGIAHEIKNPLNFVNNFANLSVELLDELKETAGPVLAQADTDTRTEIDETIELLTGNLEKIAEHGKRADNIVKSMLEHSRGVSGERREVDLNGLIEEALNLAYHGARAHDQNFNITLKRDYAASLKPIELAPQEITRVFLNLFGNGFYAANKRTRANGDGSFHPVLAVATREAEDAVEVRVRDNGTGIAPEIRDKLFQPFFTTKPTGEGTGLGLSISYDIITQQHGGTITVESEPGLFTEFTVRLPRH